MQNASLANALAIALILLAGCAQQTVTIEQLADVKVVELNNGPAAGDYRSALQNGLTGNMLTMNGDGTYIWCEWTTRSPEPRLAAEGRWERKEASIVFYDGQRPFKRLAPIRFAAEGQLYLYDLGADQELRKPGARKAIREVGSEDVPWRGWILSNSLKPVEQSNRSVTGVRATGCRI